MKTITAIFIGIGIWFFAAVAFMSSAFLSILNDPELQANLLLALALIPIVTYGTSAYLKRYKNSNLRQFQIKTATDISQRYKNLNLKQFQIKTATDVSQSYQHKNLSKVAAKIFNPVSQAVLAD